MVCKVVHQFAQAQVQQAASQPAQVPVENITFHLKWFIIIWRSSTHQSTTQFSSVVAG